MRKIIIILLTLTLLLVGCQNEETNVNDQEVILTWDETVEMAKGTEVTFYGWGGSQRVNEWLDTTVSDYLQTEYDITLERVPMNIDEILNKLLGEKQLEADGTIDIVWINGENFSTAKDNDLLYGPFADNLPHFNDYIDPSALEVQYDFGYPIDGYEVPYGKAQFVLIGDGDKTDLPTDHEALMTLVKEHPGKFTYPALPDFVGSAFVRNLLYDIVGYEQLKGLEADKEMVREAIQPAMDYLLAIKPYLWMDGQTYPATSAQLDNMYADGEVIMTMSYNPNHVTGKIQTGEFAASSQAFLFDNGTIGNTHYLAIPDNAPNKEAAMVVINAIITPFLQASKYDPAVWGDLPVLDNDKLSADELALFTSVKIGEGVPPQSELLEKRVPELPVYLIPIIEEIWMESIPGE